MIIKEWLKQYYGIKENDISIEYGDNLTIKEIKIKSAAERGEDEKEEIKELIPIDNIKVIWEEKKKEG